MTAVSTDAGGAVLVRVIHDTASADYDWDSAEKIVCGIPAEYDLPPLADEVRISLEIAKMRWKTEGVHAAAASLLRSGRYLEQFYGNDVADRIIEIPLKAVIG